MGTEWVYLEERYLPLGKTFGKVTPLITEMLTKENYLSLEKTPILKGASGETHPFERMFNENRHLCHNDPNLAINLDLISLGPTDNVKTLEQ
jgi:hypothetical protein